MISIFFFQAEDGIRDGHVTGVQTCALPISLWADRWYRRSAAGLFARDQLSVGRRSDGTGLFDRRTGRVGERSEERRVGKGCRSRWWRGDEHKRRRKSDIPMAVRERERR